jgi:hypothetical protein
MWPRTRRSARTGSSAYVRAARTTSAAFLFAIIGTLTVCVSVRVRACVRMVQLADVVFVYTLGSLLRVSVSNAASKIMFNDLPSVDAILDMCHVRAPARTPPRTRPANDRYSPTHRMCTLRVSLAATSWRRSCSAS